MQNSFILRYLFCLAIALMPIISLAGPANSSEDSMTVKKAESIITSAVIQSSTPSIYVDALNKLKQVKSAEEMQRYTLQTLTGFASIALSLKRFDLANLLLNRAQRYCTEKDSITYYEIYSGIAYIELSEGGLNASYSKLLKILEFYKKRNKHYQYIVTLLNISTYYRLTDNRAKAKMILKKAYQETVAHKQTLLQIEISLALFACDDDNELDYNLIITAIRLAQTHNFTPLYPKCQLALARYYEGKLQDEQAFIAFDKTIDLARKYNDNDCLIEALRRKGDIYERRNNYQLAYYLYRQVLTTEAQVEEKNKKTIQNFMANTQKLLNWCDKNVRMEHGTFKLIDDDANNTTGVYVAVGVVVLVLLLAAGWLLRGKRKMAVALETEKMKSNELSSLLSETASKVDHNNSLIAEMEQQISYLLLFYNNHNTLLDKIRNAVRSCYGKDNAVNNELRKICAQIMDYRLIPISSNFTEKQEKMMKNYQDKLLSLYPKLSKNEILLATYIYLGLSTHEICILTGNQAQSVNIGRYRLRKSMNLDREANLEVVLRNISPFPFRTDDKK